MMMMMIFARRIHLNVKPHWGSNNICRQCFQIVWRAFVETYKRKILLAVVIHLEWDMAPGSRLDKAGGQYPFITASRMSSKYRSVAVTSGNSASIW